MRALGALAGVATLAVLTVVAASVTIRLGASDLGESIAIVRGVHRAAASLAALLVFALSALALRRREIRATAIAALVLTVLLSIVGWITGTEPPRPAAAFNQLGGIALAALLAWRAGRESGPTASAPRLRALAAAAVLFAGVQAAYGATLATTFFPDPPPVPFLLAHAALGLAAAAMVAALGVRFAAAGSAATGFALVACAALAPLAGAFAAMTAIPLAFRVGHAFAAALLLAAATHGHARVAPSA
ncbi:MAG: hypothetical protein HYX43_00285 [Burkholderiales bacterium]|nr:hypothetical protein [Burkholderiales bacterium]